MFLRVEKFTIGSWFPLYWLDPRYFPFQILRPQTKWNELLISENVGSKLLTFDEGPETVIDHCHKIGPETKFNILSRVVNAERTLKLSWDLTAWYRQMATAVTNRTGGNDMAVAVRVYSGWPLVWKWPRGSRAVFPNRDGLISMWAGAFS
jgi:hypothetical protein